MTDADYAAAGAVLSEDLSGAKVIFAVKEVPIAKLIAGKTYLFFSHVIKGQPYNMPLLRAMLDKKITMIDYERIADDAGRRSVFFGRQAGQAGVAETLYTLGQRLLLEGRATPLAAVKRCYDYEDLADVKASFAALGGAIAAAGDFSHKGGPLVVGFTGYGNVSQGAQDVFDVLPHDVVTPAGLAALFAPGAAPPLDRFYKVVFQEEHMFAPADGAKPFDKQEYFAKPELYRAAFAERYLPYLTVVVNCIYWTPACPMLISNADAAAAERLLVVGDITCDIEGSIQFTQRGTDPGAPTYTYAPATGTWADGVTADGINVMAVDTLPCELPRDASRGFSTSLAPFLPALVAADYGAALGELQLPADLLRAVICHRGQLAPEYEYLNKAMEAEGV
jgi:alpha-aminoadipic semialdehyde synthase